MAPLSIGIITASFSARRLVGRLGRRLVALGLTVMGAGTASYLAVILLAPGATWALLFPLLACGLGMGGCFGSVFSVALGDVRPDQAGSASGTLSAVQQIANAAGAALTSAAYLAAAAAGTGRDAVAACLAIVLVITALSLAALPLLSRRAATDTH
jgi:predicted MFS family arabinose efflux permease